MGKIPSFTVTRLGKKPLTFRKPQETAKRKKCHRTPACVYPLGKIYI